MNSKYFWLLDAGHGGIDKDGKYVTAPSKMFVFPDGYTIYEGVVNRGIQKQLSKKLLEAGIDYKTTNHYVVDTPLRERVAIANSTHKYYNNCILISIHSNAGGGHGNEIYTSKGQTKSDSLVAYFADHIIEAFPDMVFRQDFTDGDIDKEAEYYILKNTTCPAVLLENGFMDNRKEAELLNSAEGQLKYATAIFNAIINIEKDKPIC